MKTTEKLGIWMDHTIAHVMELNNNSIVSTTIESLFLQGEKQNFGKDESLKYNTEQDQLSDYFKRLSAIVWDFPDVLIFGPTNAKTELFNLLKMNKLFNNIKIRIESSDYLTENQMHAFVKDHFDKAGKTQ